jgi:hypothetical protein
MSMMLMMMPNMRTTAVQQNELGWHQLVILVIMIRVIIAEDDETR